MGGIFIYMDMSQILGSNPLVKTMINNGTDLNQQITPASTNFSPDLQGVPFPPAPNKSMMSSMGPMPTNPPSNNPMGVHPPSMTNTKPLKGMAPPGSESEAQSIIRILGERALALTRMEEKAHGEQIKSKTEPAK